MKKRMTKPSATTNAMHSAGSPNWGSPMVVRRFSARVLAPAAMGRSIDLDYATSPYWQQWWDDADRPHTFLDGSKGKDVLVKADRKLVGGRLGSGHFNPPGIGGGKMVKKCWELFEEDHRAEILGSGFYVGFSVEQFGSLQNVGQRNPLTCGLDDLITTIVPSRRVHYTLHPEQLIAITLKKQKRRPKKSKQWLIEQRLIERLRGRKNDAPIDGGAPSHLSFMSILWHRSRAVRRTQMEAARKFLSEQKLDPKSTFHKYEAIGPLELT